MKKQIYVIVFIALIMLLSLPVSSLCALDGHQDPPAAYSGSINYKGSPVNDGNIVAYVERVRCSNIVAVNNGYYGKVNGFGESLSVGGWDLSGKKVQFCWISADTETSRWAEQEVDWISGEFREDLNLTLKDSPAQASNDAALKNLKLTVGSLKPEFSSSITKYSVELPAGTEITPQVLAELSDPNAVMEINNAANVNASKPEERTTRVIVRAEDAVTTSTYEIEFTVAVPPGEGCFIATAAFGSYLDPHVWVLRQFRDQVLLQNSWGQALVAFYYQNSPPAAAFIAQHDSLRFLTRCLLTPVIVAIEYPLGAMAILLIALLLFRRQGHA